MHPGQCPCLPFVWSRAHPWLSPVDSILALRRWRPDVVGRCHGSVRRVAHNRVGKRHTGVLVSKKGSLVIVNGNRTCHISRAGKTVWGTALICMRTESLVSRARPAYYQIAFYGCVAASMVTEEFIDKGELLKIFQPLNLASVSCVAISHSPTHGHAFML